MTNALKAAWQSWRYSDDRPYTQRFLDNFTESQFKEFADVAGFDPRSISREKMAEAWATANFIWDDAETQTLLLQFAGEFIGAQHKLEVLEGAGQIAGEIAIDILITAITVGAGAVVVSSRKIKLLEKFKKLGPLFEKLAEAIKKCKKRKRKGGQTGSEIPEQLERPETVDSKKALKRDSKELALEQERRDGGHSLNRHGPQVSDQELKDRILTGHTPDGKFSPTDSSTRFKSYDDWVTTKETALESIQTKNNVDFGENMDIPPKPGEPLKYSIAIDHNRAIDEGFNGAGQKVKANDPSNKNKTGKVYTQTTEVSGITKTQTTVAWNPDKQRWVVAQHFPVGRGWNQSTQSYQ